jgi:hypothetical protein
MEIFVVRHSATRKTSHLQECIASLSEQPSIVSIMRAVSYLFLVLVLAPQIASESLQPNRHEAKIVTGQKIPSPFRIVRCFHYLSSCC